MLIEACVDSPESAVAAENGGAKRVELCAALLEGGLTPSAGAMALAREQLGIGVHVIIRPCGSDLLSTGAGHTVMLRDNPRVYMGGLLRPPEYTRSVTDAGTIGTLVRLAEGSDD